MLALQTFASSAKSNTDKEETIFPRYDMPIKAVLLVALLAATISTFAISGSVEGAVDDSAQVPILRGPVFISVVFPVVELNQERLELIDSIPEAYSFWGRMIISMTMDKAYFPAPLSYPYRFTKRGLTALQQAIKRHSEVDSGSVQVRTASNIPKEQQYLYEPGELKQILIREEYVSFRLKRWNDIELMAFPTFLVLAFDHTKTRINSNRDYDQVIKKRFSPVLTEFQKMEDLRGTLGISRKTQRWANIPVLTFTAIDSYQENVIYKIYLNGPIAPEEARRLFLQHVSVRDYSKGLDNVDARVTQCNEIGHEISSISVWRLYYAGIPLFYDEEFGQRMDIFHLHGPRGAQSRILRTALFVNVTLPSLVKLSENVQQEVAQMLQQIRFTRAKLFNEFSNKIDELNEPIVSAVRALETRTEPAIKRLEEALAGYDRLLDDIQYSFIPPLRRPGIKTTTQSQEPDICLGLFYFDERVGSVLNDRVKAKSFVDQIRANIRSIQQDKDELSNELPSAMSLLESRRNLIWGRDNTELSMTNAQKNTLLSIQNAQQNTQQSINNAIKIALLVLIVGQLLTIVATILIQLWLRRHDERRQELVRLKVRKKEEESNRRYADDI